jgi:hypothetical protein
LGFQVPSCRFRVWFATPARHAVTLRRIFSVGPAAWKLMVSARGAGEAGENCWPLSDRRTTWRPAGMDAVEVGHTTAPPSARRCPGNTTTAGATYRGVGGWGFRV